MPNSIDSPTLVIIDVQPDDYDEAKSRRLLGSIREEIRKAKNRRAGIIVVEFAGDGSHPTPTHSSIIRALEGYKRWGVVQKSEYDGSEQIMQYAISNGFCISRFVVCGLFTSICVTYTVRGLIKHHSYIKVRVVKKACRDDARVYWKNVVDIMTDSSPEKRSQLCLAS